MRQQLPVTVISGFLGAGKTTLVNRLLESDGALRIAVLVNDFGAINVDQRLIASTAAEVMTLTNGCVCCSLQGGLVAQVQELARQGGFDHLVIETSGVAEPGQVVLALGYPQIRDEICVSGVATLLDAERFPQLTGAARELAEAQLLSADMAVISKTDLAAPAAVEALRARCRSLGVRCLDSSATEAVLTALFGPEALRPAAPAVLVPAGAVHLPASAVGMHAGTHSETPFEHWSFGEERPLDVQALRGVLSSLPQEVYRAKGFVYLGSVADMECLVQVVGDRVDVRRAGPWSGERGTALVFIGLRGRVDWRELEHRLRGSVSLSQ
jgi:G3E family GTPase